MGSLTFTHMVKPDPPEIISRYWNNKIPAQHERYLIYMKTCPLIKILPVALIGLILYGCESSEMRSPKLFIREISDIADNKYQFEYESGHLISYKSVYGQRVAKVTTFEYQNDQLVRVDVTSDYGESAVIELEYGLPGLVEREIYNYAWDIEGDKGNYTRTTFFEYDENEMLKSQLVSYDDANSGMIRIDFSWNKGNIVKRTYNYLDSSGKFLYFGGLQLFAYDNRRNYTNQDFAFIYTTFGGVERALSRHNVIAINNDWQDGTGNFSIQSAFEFTYNDNGYPIKYVETDYGQTYAPVFNMKYE